MTKRVVASRVGMFASLCLTVVLGYSLLQPQQASAAGVDDSAPVWRTGSGAIVLLAATSKKQKKIRKRKSKGSAVHKPGRDFDHLLTGFPLFGVHADVECGSCHLHGILKGTPTRCELCHSLAGQRAETVKPSNHIQTQLPCDQCHNESTWAGARFDHAAIAPGTCERCHNGGTAPGKPGGHPSTSLSCDSCHRTTAWLPARFNHASVSPGTCKTCHGVTATGQPASHTTTESCDVCHSTTAWLPASAHGSGGPAPGSCNSCHLNDIPGGHFVLASPRSCDECHNDTRWLPIKGYSHSNAYYKQHNPSVTCNNCHNNLEVLVWRNPADKAFCGGCHQSRFIPGPHVKEKLNETTYSYEDLKDCTTSCHIYTDPTLTTIDTSRPGHHNSTDGGW